MSNKKVTKRALLTSILAICLCLVMLIGSTFAWFTDTASTSVNQIQSGTLKVGLKMATEWNEDGTVKTWSDAKGQVLNFRKAAGHENEATLWEPGCTYELPALKVVNEGNLALKYKIVINGIQGSAKLLNAIEWTISDTKLEGDHSLPVGETSEELIIKGHMKDDAGNEYQDQTLEGIAITVMATQLASEFDSFTYTYDTNATYLNTEKDADGNITYLIGTADELVYFAKTVNVDGETYAGQTIKLTSDINLGGRNWAPIQANANLVFDGNGMTISNFSATGDKNVGFFGTATKCTIKNLTISDVTVTGINHVAAIAGDALCATIDSCVVKNAKITTAVKNNDDGDKAGAIAGYLSAEPNASVTNCRAEGCTIKGYRDIGGLVGYANAAATITGNSVVNTTIINDRTNNYKGYTEDAEFDVNAIVGEYNSNTLDASNTATDVTIQTVKPVSSQEELNEAINGATAGTTIAIPADLNVKLDKDTKIQEGVTLAGAGKDETTLNADNLKISNENVTLKDMTIKGSGSAGTGGTLNINGNNTTIENVDYQGDGNIAITVSTGKNNTGTVFKDVKITNAFRGIQFWSLSGDSVIDNCVLDIAGYTFNIDAAVADSTLTIKDSTLNGWTSYTSGIKLVTFDNCKLGLKAYQYLRPYSETKITNCEFTSADYQLNAGGTGAYTITLTDCTKNGTAITPENVQSLLLDMDDWNSNATLVVNGKTVTLS